MSEISSNKLFESERLLLKPTSEADAPFILELMNTPKWIKHIGDRNIKSIESAKKYIRTKIEPQYKQLGFSNYTVIRKSDNAKIGSCGLYDRDGLEGVDIGFAFLPDYEKKGYAYESANLVKQIAIDEFGIRELSGITNKENIASQKLLLKIGLKFEKEIQLPNESEKVLLFKLRVG